MRNIFIKCFIIRVEYKYGPSIYLVEEFFVFLGSLSRYSIKKTINFIDLLLTHGGEMLNNNHKVYTHRKMKKNHQLTSYIVACFVPQTFS